MVLDITFKKKVSCFRENFEMFNGVQNAFEAPKPTIQF